MMRQVFVGLPVVMFNERPSVLFVQHAINPLKHFFHSWSIRKVGTCEFVDRALFDQFFQVIKVHAVRENAYFLRKRFERIETRTHEKWNTRMRHFVERILPSACAAGHHAYRTQRRHICVYILKRINGKIFSKMNILQPKCVSKLYGFGEVFSIIDIWMRHYKCNLFIPCFTVFMCDNHCLFQPLSIHRPHGRKKENRLVINRGWPVRVPVAISNDREPGFEFKEIGNLVDMILRDTVLV